MMVIPAAISLFNGAGKFALDKMTIFERYWDDGAMINSASVKMSILTIVNIGFVILFLDAY